MGRAFTWSRGPRFFGPLVLNKLRSQALDGPQKYPSKFWADIFVAGNQGLNIFYYLR